MIMLHMAPAAVPFFQKKAPNIAGTVMRSPADAATESLTMESSLNAPKTMATTEITGITHFPSLSSISSDARRLNPL